MKTEEYPPSHPEHEGQRDTQTNEITSEAKEISAAIRNLSGEFTSFTDQIQTNQEAQDRQRQNCEQKHLFWTRLGTCCAIGLNFLTLVVIGFTAYIADQQRGITEGQLAEMRTGSKDTQAIANAAKLSADAAVSTARAWISMTSFAYTGVKEGNQTFEMTFHNIGKTPARDVRATWEFLLIESPDIHLRPKYGDWVCPTQQERRPGVIRADGDFKVQIVSGPMPDSHIQMLKEEKARLYVHGCVQYLDVLTTEQRITEVTFYFPSIYGSEYIGIYHAYNRMK